jgi:hypothetical protein
MENLRGERKYMDIEMLQSQIDSLKDEMRELRRELDEIKKQLTPTESPIPWDKAPTFARWAAMDEDCSWWWYEKEPTMGTILWKPELYTGYKGFEHTPALDWTESKQARP